MEGYPDAAKDQYRGKRHNRKYSISVGRSFMPGNCLEHMQFEG